MPTAQEREIAELKAKLALMERAIANESTITFKVGEKGGVSAYGLGRFPVTLYYEQWERLTAPQTLDRLKAFIGANKSKLKTKAQAIAERLETKE